MAASGRPIKVILIRNPGSSEGFDVALASTDTEVPAPELIARYDSHWTIETAHQEAKAHGVGQAPNRVQRAVERTVPFGFLSQTITIAWYALYGDPKQTSTPSPVVSPEAHHQLHRHARRATPRTHPPRLLGTSTPHDHQPGTHTTPDATGISRRLKLRKSSHILRRVLTRAHESSTLRGRSVMPRAASRRVACLSRWVGSVWVLGEGEADSSSEGRRDR
jgi:hypothetical protein